MKTPDDVFLAHSANERGECHILRDHLIGTAERAASFARNPFEQRLFRYAALIHDAGKYQSEFQDYLLHGGARGSVPHAAIGAALRYRHVRQNAVALAVLGHHQGLLDIGRVRGALEGEKESTLAAVERRLFGENPEIAQLENDLPKEHTYNKNDLASEFFTRYLFSVLTDADWLDTEAHFSPEKSESRPSHALNIEELLAHLDEHFASLPSEGSINGLRNRVRDEAISHADLPTGLFSLNVPTGLGKTLTSVYWALRHARANRLKRIIIVLPFVNIIDQTAQKLAEIFGEEVVLEHHSGVLEESEEFGRDEEQRPDPKKLATENWDYPIIVTTTVQFFESLFSNRPSKCRKIHNIADSVVIFDEVQALTPELVLPTLEMLKQVQKILNASFLFCTATLPAFEAREGFAGFDVIHPLISEPQSLFERTKRVAYSALNEFQPVPLERLVNDLCSHNSAVLVVVNTKKDASRIFSALNQTARFERMYHLSTNMVPAHRKGVICEIRDALLKRRRICVVSTQLIEAGVDFDFPVVFRALAPLESIIQAAGRCNREGQLPEPGKVLLFSLEGGGMPPGLYATCAQHARDLIEADIGFLDRYDSFHKYYRQVHSLFVGGDKRQINSLRNGYKFEQVAAGYKLIDQGTRPVFVRAYDEKSRALFETIRHKPLLSRSDARKLQPYLVSFYQNALSQNQSYLDQTSLPGICIWEGPYDPDLGIVFDGYSPDQLVV